MRSSSVETAATLPFSTSSSCVYSKDFIRNLQIFKSFFHCLNVHFYIEKFSWNQRPGNRPAHRLAECNTFSNLLTENERHNVKWWPLEAERVGRPLVFGESWRPVVCWALLQNWASFLANWAIKHVQPETVDQENSFKKKNQNFNGESMKIRYISCCSDTKMSSLFPGEMIYDWAFIFFSTFPFRFRGQRGSREIVGNFSRANLTGGSGHFHFLMGSHWSPVDNFGFFFQHSARFQSNSSILPRWTIAVDCSEKFSRRLVRHSTHFRRHVTRFFTNWKHADDALVHSNKKVKKKHQQFQQQTKDTKMF